MNSIKESFILIKKNRLAFSIIFALQALLFIIIVFAGTGYIGKIIESSSGMIDYAESLNLNGENAQISMMQQQNIFGEDPLLISRSYNEIIASFSALILVLFLSFFVLNGLMWYFASSIGAKKIFSLRNISAYLLKFSVIALLVFSAFLALLYSSMLVFFSEFLSSDPKKPLLLLVALPILIYFLYISMPIVRNSGFKQSAKKAFDAGRRFPILMSCILILSLIGMSSFLVFYLLESNLLLLLASIFFFVSVFSWAKVYFSVAVRKSGSHL